MTEIDFDIPKLDALMLRLKHLNDPGRVLLPPMLESLSLLQKELSEYPNKAPGAFSAMASDAQKRAFWAGVRSGRIPFDKRTGYRRTGTTGRKWTARAYRVHGGIEGRVGNNTPYAKYVQGPYSEDFHRASGWKRTDEVARKRAPAILRKFKAAIDRELKRI